MPHLQLRAGRAVEVVRQRRHEPGAKRRGGGILPLVVSDRHHRSGVHRDHGRLHLPAKSAGLPRREEGGEVIRHHERRAAGEVHQRRRPSRRPSCDCVVAVPLEIEGVLDAKLVEFVVQVGDRLEQEGVQPVARPGVVVPQTVVDEQRESEAVGLLDPEIESLIVPRAKRALHPVEHVLAAMAGCRLRGGMDAEIVGHRGHGGEPQAADRRRDESLASEESDSARAAPTMLRSIPANTSWWIPQRPYQYRSPPTPTGSKSAV